MEKDIQIEKYNFSNIKHKGFGYHQLITTMAANANLKNVICTTLTSIRCTSFD